MPARHFTPPPFPTLEQAWHRIDVLNDDIGEAEEDIKGLKEKVHALMMESARADERGARVKEKLEDHSEAVKKFRYRDAQLILLGCLAMAILGVLLKWAMGIKIVVPQ